MPVIINDLEVVIDVEPPQPQDATVRPATASALRPEDINDIVERQARALARVLAH